MRARLSTLAILAVLAVPPSAAFADGEVPPTTDAAPAAVAPASPAPAVPSDPVPPAPDAAASTTAAPAPPATPLTPTPIPGPTVPESPSSPGAPTIDPTPAKPSERRPRKGRDRDRAGRDKPSKPGKDDDAKDEDAAERTAADVLSAPATRLSALSVARFRIPPFLLPIYQAAGVQYGIRWEILAAINEIETDYGRNLNVSTAGAEGWMQFMPATWKTYGVDANGDGDADPYNPVDAVFAAARYLKAAGGTSDIERAVFAYNHAGWYVDDVLKRAKAIAGLPADVVSSLTGLTLAQPPVHVRGAAAKAAAAEDARTSGSSSAGATSSASADAGTSASSTPKGAKKASSTPAARPARKKRRDGLTLRPTDRDRWARIGAPAGSDVVAVQDATVIRLGNGPKLGRFIELRDAYGNRYKYAGLDELATRHLVARPTKADDHEHEDDEPGAGESDAAKGSGSGAAGAEDTGADDSGAASAGDATGANGSATPDGRGAGATGGASATTGGSGDPVPTAPATAGRPGKEGSRSNSAGPGTRSTRTRDAGGRADAVTPAPTGRTPLVALGPARPSTVADTGGPTTGRGPNGPADDRGLAGSPFPPAPSTPVPPTQATTTPATPPTTGPPTTAPTPAAPGAGADAPGPATPDAGGPAAGSPATTTPDAATGPGAGTSGDPAAPGAAGTSAAPLPGSAGAPGAPAGVTATTPTDPAAGTPTDATTPGWGGPTTPGSTTPLGAAIAGAPGSPSLFGALPGTAPAPAPGTAGASTTLLAPAGLFGQALANPGVPAWRLIVQASPAPAPPAAPEPAASSHDDEPAGDRVQDVDRWMVRAGSLRRSDVRLRPLRKGSKVLAGSILGTTSTKALRLAIRPAGKGTPRIDPRPIVAGWRLLDDASVFGHDDRSDLVADRGDRPDVGRILLMSKAQLQARVLADPKLEIYEAGRDDIRTGAIDRRVLATMEYLTANGLRLSISSLKSGHSILSASGNVSAHSYGAAMDIASVDGVPITGHQGAGSITASTIRLLLRLQGTVRPNQIISLMTFAGADNTLAMADHDDHIHVGFPRTAADGDTKLGKQVSAVLQPSQWGRLVDRLADIENPKVRRGVSESATTEKKASKEER